MRSPLHKGRGFYSACFSPFICLSGRFKLRNIVAVLLCLIIVAFSFLIHSTPALAATSITLNPTSGVSGTNITITGSGFAASTAGYIWFDTDGDNIMDSDEPLVSVTSTDTGAIPDGTTLTAPTVAPNKSYEVRADIPEGSPIEASATFSTPYTTTYLTVTKCDAHGSILDQTTNNYTSMEAHLPVYGDGVTHYYCEGPYFSSTDFNTLWDTSENGDNIDSRDYGAPKGTDVKDLCNLVGGASPGDVIKITASDGVPQSFDYENVYNPSPAQGKIVICWYNDSFGGYVPAYDTGMRLLFFADNSANPWHWHVFGLWDMHQTLPASRWHYRIQSSTFYPSSSGLSLQCVSKIEIFPPNLVSCDASGNQKENFTPGDTVYVKGVGLAKNAPYKLWIQNEPVLFNKLDSLDCPDGYYVFDATSDPSGTQESVSTDANGDFSPLAIWAISSSASPNKFDIVADNQAAGTIGRYDTKDAIDSPGLQGFSVVTEVISITLTDADTAGINFGTLNAGVTGQGDVDQSNGTPAVRVNVGNETNVNVDIGIKGSTAGTLALSNWKYSTTFAGTETPLTGAYVAVYTDKAAGSSSDFYHWIDIPGGTASGAYTCTVYYRAVKTGTGF